MTKAYDPNEVARLQKKAKREALGDTFALQILTHFLPTPIREYCFHPKRDWRFDFAWPERMLAAEVEGGEWVQGRHQRPGGFRRDTEKYNAALALGWRVLRFTGSQVKDGSAIKTLHEVMGDEASEKA